MIKLFTFLSRKPGLTHEEFCDYWRTAHGPLVAATSAFGRHVRRYVQSHAIGGAAVPELTLSAFDGAGELWFDSADDLAATLTDADHRAALDASAERFVDPASVIRLVAEESVQWDRGFGRVKFIGLSRRAAAFATREEWIRYWIEVHGPLAHGVPEFTRYYGRYVHNYVLPHDLATGGQEPGYDGIVEEWLESVEAMVTCLAEPRYLEIVRPDELKFVDFARSHMLVTEEHVIHAGRAGAT
jgi:uncharacterized protein (TIGR02118 family)